VGALQEGEKDTVRARLRHTVQVERASISFLRARAASARAPSGPMAARLWRRDAFAGAVFRQWGPA